MHELPFYALFSLLEANLRQHDNERGSERALFLFRRGVQFHAFLTQKLKNEENNLHP